MAISISNTTYENLYIGQGYIKDIFINQSKAVLSLVIGETKKDKVYPQISFYEVADSILMSRLGITGNRIESANQYVISGKIISALSVTDNLLSIIVESYYDNYWRNSINKTYTTVYFFHKNAKKLQESIHPGDFLSEPAMLKPWSNALMTNARFSQMLLYLRCSSHEGKYRKETIKNIYY